MRYSDGSDRVVWRMFTKGKDRKLKPLCRDQSIKKRLSFGSGIYKEILSEAQAAAGLMHPNVVNVYDVGQDRGLYYMVMEACRRDHSEKII